MTPRSSAATQAALRLWAGATRGSAEPQAVVSAADQVCDRLRVGLGRWIGAEGYRALLGRALALTRPEFPLLTGLLCDGKDGPEAASAVRRHGPAEVAEGIVGLVATLIDLLSRIVGEEMATRLVEQTGATALAESPDTAMGVGSHG